MRQLYIILVTTCYLLLITAPAQAQTWQWGERGGSSDGSVSGGADEYAKDIATDANGNVYVLTRSIGKNSLSLGSLPIAANWGSFDIMLSSFTCSGQLRWYKTIGCKGEDLADALHIDNKGGLYIAFHSSLAGSNSNNMYFDTDTTVFISNTSNGSCFKSVFLAKYDTTGNFQWVVSPQPDTVSLGSYQKSVILSLNVDVNGDLHCLSSLFPGLYGGIGGYTVSQQGTYILKYNASGVFQGGVKPDIDIQGASVRSAYFTRDNQLNRYYIAGEVQWLSSVYIGGQKVKGTKYIGAFNNSGNLIWKREDTASTGGITGRPVIDDTGNIYIAADTYKGDEFNGHVTITDADSKSQGSLMLMKMDKNGDKIWASNAQYVSGVNFSGGVAIRNSGEVILTGKTGRLTKWRTLGFEDSIVTPDAVYRPFLARFNTQTGKLLGLTDILTQGDNATPYNIVADGRNNVYLGGEFRSQLVVNGKTLSSAGGTKDFFVAKYGHANCNCTNIPEPEFTYTISNHFEYNFTYTGTPGTMEWDFGDGTTSTQTNVNHTYTSPNEFIACVKVTNACGDNIYCAKIDTRWPDNVQTIGEGSSMKIYPNPASDVLHIDGLASGSKIELYDMVGRKAHMIITAKENEVVNMSYLPSGNYIIQVTDNNGQRTMGKVMKR